MKRWAFALPLLVVVGLVGLLGAGLKLDPTIVDSPLIGKPAPAFELPVLGGDRLISERDLVGGVSLFNVWASWCVACRLEHDILVELGKRDDIRLFGLNYKDEPEDAQRWLARRGDPYRLSAMDRDGRVGIDWGVYGVPETFVVDTDGVIRAKHIGPLTEDYVNDELLPLIRELKDS